MPETENRTLEDIEVHFSDNKRKITDRKIQKNVSVKSFDVPADLVAKIENERKEKEKDFQTINLNEQNYEKKSNNQSIINGYGNGHTNKAFIDEK